MYRSSINSQIKVPFFSHTTVFLQLPQTSVFTLRFHLHVKVGEVSLNSETDYNHLINQSTPFSLLSVRTFSHGDLLGHADGGRDRRSV